MGSAVPARAVVGSGDRTHHTYAGHVSVSVKNRGEAKVGRRGAMDSETKEAVVDGEAECYGACGKARLKFQMVSLKISRRPMRRVCPRIGRARRYESERHRPL